MACDHIRIVLVEPAGPLNIGSVARVMKNFGLTRLFLVNPQCDARSQLARQMAVHGIDILDHCNQVATLPDALHGCYRAIATTGSDRDIPLCLEPPQTVLPWLFEHVPNAVQHSPSHPLLLEGAVIFGREDRGLTNQELHYAQRLLQIPANPVYPSLNLAQAVAICCYELSKAQSLHEAEEFASSDTQPANFSLASLDALEQYYQHLEALLLKIGYLYTHTAKSRMEKFRRLYNRIQISEQEVAMLRGILRQVEWALGKAKQ